MNTLIPISEHSTHFMCMGATGYCKDEKEKYRLCLQASGLSLWMVCELLKKGERIQMYQYLPTTECLTCMCEHTYLLSANALAVSADNVLHNRKFWCLPIVHILQCHLQHKTMHSIRQILLCVQVWQYGEHRSISSMYTPLLA
jgi:hypothetical protein